ncbi:MAG: transporter substrate-binding domain-containing protein, partial [Anaerotignaceae bacterium]
KLITTNYESWNGIKVGMLNGNSRNQSFFDFANQNNFQFEAVYYENINDLTHALQTTEEVDAILTSNLRYITNEWIIAEFDPSPFYIMVQKGNTEFLNEINKVLDLLYSDEPWLNFLLDSEYYTPQSGNEIFYTTEEREYIEKMKDTTFTAILNPDRPPYSYFSNGEAKGIFADVAKEIIERTGLNIEILAPSSRAEYRQLISEGKVDIQFDARNNYTEAEAAGYRLTNSYFSPTISILRSKENNKFSTVALLEQADITKEYFEHFGEEYADVFYYDSLEDVINAVSSGKQDFTLLYSLVGEKAIHDNLRNNLVVEKIYKRNTDFSVAVNIQEGPLLYSIINKT